MFRFLRADFNRYAKDFFFPNSLYKSSNVYPNSKSGVVANGKSTCIPIPASLCERYSLISFTSLSTQSSLSMISFRGMGRMPKVAEILLLCDLRLFFLFRLFDVPFLPALLSVSVSVWLLSFGMLPPRVQMF